MSVEVRGNLETFGFLLHVDPRALTQLVLVANTFTHWASFL